MSSIPANEGAVNQTLARDEALGPVEGPCCQPEISPCLSCAPPDLYPDDIPFVLSEEDEQFYREWCREREARLREERLAADARRAEADLRLVAGILTALEALTFQDMLASFANAFRDHESPTVAWIGGILGERYDQARFFDATSPESYEDRRACMLDAEAARIEARMAAHAGY